LLAFVSLTLAPAVIFYLMAQKHIIAGLTSGAGEGLGQPVFTHGPFISGLRRQSHGARGANDPRGKGVVVIPATAGGAPHRVDRLQIPSICMTDGPHGLRKVEGEGLGLSTSVPRDLFPNRFGLGLFPGIRGSSGKSARRWPKKPRPATCRSCWAPAVNMKTLAFGRPQLRVFLRRTPVLAGKMAAAYIEGVQSQGVGTSLKTLRGPTTRSSNAWRPVPTWMNAPCTRSICRLLKSPSKRAQPWSVMAAYNPVNGVYATENNLLLQDILRSRWGFEGFVVSDWGGRARPRWLKWRRG